MRRAKGITGQSTTIPLSRWVFSLLERRKLGCRSRREREQCPGSPDPATIGGFRPMAHLLSLSRRGRFVLRVPNGRLADLIAHHSQHALLVQIGIGELR